jgi:hypothetical protein
MKTNRKILIVRMCGLSSRARIQTEEVAYKYPIV